MADVKARGVASWYGPGFYGNRTADGTVLTRDSLWVAHRTLPFGTKIEFTNPNNGRSIVLTVKDRGPFKFDREYDLTEKAAELLGVKTGPRTGTASLLSREVPSSTATGIVRNLGAAPSAPVLPPPTEIPTIPTIPESTNKEGYYYELYLSNGNPDIDSTGKKLYYIYDANKKILYTTRLSEENIPSNLKPLPKPRVITYTPLGSEFDVPESEITKIENKDIAEKTAENNRFLDYDPISGSFSLIKLGNNTEETLSLIINQIEKDLQSDDPNVRETAEEQRKELQEALSLINKFGGKCITRQSIGKYELDLSPECNSFWNSELGQEILQLYNKEVTTTDTCGKSTVAKINTALLNFFNTLKEIKLFGEVYIFSSINKIQDIVGLVRSTAEIIGAVLKTLTQRLRNWIIEKIRRGLNDLKDLAFPTVAKLIKDTVVEQIIQGLFCAFDDIINGLVDFVIDFLMALVNEIINPVFCAIEQFTSAMVNKLARQIDEKLGPILDKISDVLGQGAKIFGSVLQAIDYILGFESFLCAKPNCEEIKKFKLGPDGNGPGQTDIDNWENILNKVPSSADAQTFLTEGADSLLSDFLGDASDVNAGPLGCNTDPYRCGPPKVVLFGGGGIGAAADAIVDTIGQVVGANLTSGGSGYSSPPFVVFEDSCRRGNGASAYAEIEDGEVVRIIIVNSGNGYLNQPDGTDEFGTEEPTPPQEQNVRNYIGCLSEFQVLNMGYGYSVNDSIILDPDVPNLQASVSITEEGQIVSITPLNLPCNITEIPAVRINSNTGSGAVIKPIIKFTAIEDFDVNQEGFDPQKLVRVIDCVSR